MMMKIPMKKSNIPLIQNQRNILHIQLISPSSHPKMPQKSFLPPNIWETPPESTKEMIIEHNKKAKLNNPTPY